MASRQGTVDFIIEQMAGAGAVHARKMFGEYAVFCGGKLVGLICDDALFVKPTEAGRAYLGDAVERPPYRSSKPFFWISGDLWEDGQWLAELVRVTAEALPFPVKKVRRRRAG